MIDFCLIALSGTMASPIAWEHHYGITLPIFAVLLAGSIGDHRRLAWLAVAYVLVSTFLPITNFLAATPLNILQSSLLAGAMILLVLLHQRQGASAPVGSKDPERIITARKQPGIFRMMGRVRAWYTSPRERGQEGAHAAANG